MVQYVITFPIIQIVGSAFVTQKKASQAGTQQIFVDHEKYALINLMAP